MTGSSQWFLNLVRPSVGGFVRLLTALLLGVSLLYLPDGQAIIIRHDKSYVSYQARESQFPAVFYLERQGSRKVCVATLVDSYWAITAAHCAWETALLATLNAGGHFPVSLAGNERRISGLVVHPDFDPGSPGEVDLALLRFAEPVPFPAPLALYKGNDEAGQVVSLMGWGFFGIGTTGRQFDDGRFRLARNRIEQADRRLRIQFDDPRAPDSGALELEGTPGLGDSGGPALLQGEAGWTLAGIAVGELMDEDFDEEFQGNYGSVAVYERVSRHLGWITRTISTSLGAGRIVPAPQSTTVPE